MLSKISLFLAHLSAQSCTVGMLRELTRFPPLNTVKEATVGQAVNYCTSFWNTCKDLVRHEPLCASVSFQSGSDFTERVLVRPIRVSKILFCGVHYGQVFTYSESIWVDLTRRNKKQRTSSHIDGGRCLDLQLGPKAGLIIHRLLCGLLFPDLLYIQPQRSGFCIEEHIEYQSHPYGKSTLVNEISVIHRAAPWCRINKQVQRGNRKNHYIYENTTAFYVVFYFTPFLTFHFLFLEGRQWSSEMKRIQKQIQS